MKKKIVGLALIALIASLFVIKEKQTKYSMSDLSMANIEALASGEGPDWKGYKTVYGPSRTCCQSDASWKICSGAHSLC